VKRPFDLLDQFPHVVIAEARAQAQRSRFDLERWKGSRLGAGVQPDTETVIHDLFERCAGLACFGPKLSCHVVVKS
jgi:hypothetical protein